VKSVGGHEDELPQLFPQHISPLQRLLPAQRGAQQQVNGMYAQRFAQALMGLRHVAGGDGGKRKPAQGCGQLPGDGPAAAVAGADDIGTDDK